MQLTMPRALPRQVTGPVVSVLARLGVTPNMLTVAQLAGGIIAGFVIARGELLAGGIILIGSATLDAFDGALARTTGKATRFGAVFDSVVDRLFEIAVLGGVLYYYLDLGQKAESMAVFVAMGGSLSVSYVRARAEGAGIEIYDGIFTRVVRLLFLTAGLMAAEVWAQALDVVIWLLAAATMLTTLHRLYAVWGAIRKIGISEGSDMTPPTPHRPRRTGLRATELDYLEANWDEIQSKYRGSWIAVEGTRVIASGPNELEADQAARRAGVSIPFVVEVPGPDEAGVPFIGVL